MRTNILIDKDGNYVNGEPALPIMDNIVGMLFSNQVTLEFVNEIKLVKSPTGQSIYVPDYESVVTSGLSGIVAISAKPTQYAPYVVELDEPFIDISDSCMLQFSGMTEYLILNCQNVVGANYINVILYRN